ncbi:hypothetical protein SLEP1_g47114 [Rubroshorea leprosula]|uniref:Uncharacterized protein n=1 Tax=Rubroshorea leprosula TaxID=152421 RepID=A0AAV5LS46_9ROSI|nr:hypothetical protein SLEP1_g47114 [Rubroshorea leprosula]
MLLLEFIDGCNNRTQLLSRHNSSSLSQIYPSKTT